ncbi:MAG TPA: branched-chain amino acid ABC transporter permease, partial [Actinomycetota bacterium]|nr:branched-chain amino acid ABC transporter permease [Actinomycetota bacterium]
MHLFVQGCILGVLIGGVYALMASGLTLAFGIMRVVNVAQGAMVVLGAYLSYSLFRTFHIDPFLSILLITPALFGVGVLLHRVFIRSLRGPNAEELSLLVTWATALGVEGVLSVAYTTNLRRTITGYSQSSWV